MLCLFLCHSALLALALFSSCIACNTSSIQPFHQSLKQPCMTASLRLEEQQTQRAMVINIRPDSNGFFIFIFMFKVNEFFCISSSTLINFLRCAMAKRKYLMETRIFAQWMSTQLTRCASGTKKCSYRLTERRLIFHSCNICHGLMDNGLNTLYGDLGSFTPYFLCFSFLADLFITCSELQSF